MTLELSPRGRAGLSQQDQVAWRWAVPVAGPMCAAVWRERCWVRVSPEAGGWGRYGWKRGAVCAGVEVGVRAEPGQGPWHMGRGCAGRGRDLIRVGDHWPLDGLAVRRLWHVSRCMKTEKTGPGDGRDHLRSICGREWSIVWERRK